jgi:hypothetical protein
MPVEANEFIAEHTTVIKATIVSPNNDSSTPL